VDFLSTLKREGEFRKNIKEFEVYYSLKMIDISSYLDITMTATKMEHFLAECRFIHPYLKSITVCWKNLKNREPI
jgi:hypothetical protein